MRLNYKKEKGFTLIEIVISILILSVGIIGIFNAFSMVVILTSDVSNQLTGTYLAQEGMEIVRNIRDTNWLNMDARYSFGEDYNYSWLKNIDLCANGCEADYTTNTDGYSVMLPWSGDGNYLNIDSSIDTNGFYSYKTGSRTKFKRKIIIKCLPDYNCNDPINNYIMKVVVQVSWDKKATILNPETILAGASDLTDTSQCNPANCITIEETLYNWYYPNH
jgi:prepilin-type N-terminal cleavage/methylation domain-containing protein